MTEFSDQIQPASSGPKFADFGLTEGIHFRPAPTPAAPMGDGTVPAAVTPAAPVGDGTVPSAVTPAAPVGDGTALPAVKPATPAADGTAPAAKPAAPVGDATPPAAVTPATPADVRPASGDSTSNQVRSETTPAPSATPSAGSDNGLPPATPAKPSETKPAVTGSSDSETGIKPAASLTSGNPETGSRTVENGTSAPEVGTRPATPLAHAPAPEIRPEESGSPAPDQIIKPNGRPHAPELVSITSDTGAPATTTRQPATTTRQPATKPEATLPPVSPATNGDRNVDAPVHNNSTDKSPAPAPATIGSLLGERAIPAVEAPVHNADRSPAPGSLGATLSGDRSNPPAGVAPHGAELPTVRPLNPETTPAPGPAHSSGSLVDNPGSVIPEASPVPGISGRVIGSVLGNASIKVQNSPAPADLTPGSGSDPAKTPGRATVSPIEAGLGSITNGTDDRTNRSLHAPTINEGGAKPLTEGDPAQTLASLDSVLPVVTPAPRHSDVKPEAGNAGTTNVKDSILPPAIPASLIEVKPPIGRAHSTDHTGGAPDNGEVGSLAPLTEPRRPPDITRSPAPSNVLPRVTLVDDAGSDKDKVQPRHAPGSVGDILAGFSLSATNGLTEKEPPAPNSRSPFVLPVSVPNNGDRSPAPPTESGDVSGLLTATRRSLIEAPAVVNGPELPKVPLGRSLEDLLRNQLPGRAPDEHKTLVPAPVETRIPPAVPSPATLVQLPAAVPAPDSTGHRTGDVHGNGSNPSPEQTAKPVPAPTQLANWFGSTFTRTAEAVLNGGTPQEPSKLLPTAVPSPSPSPSPRTVGEVIAAPLQRDSLPGIGILTNMTVGKDPISPAPSTDVEKPARPLSPSALAILTGTGGRLGLQNETSDATHKPVATTSDAAPLTSLLNRLNNRVEDHSLPVVKPSDSLPLPSVAVPRPERTLADSLPLSSVAAPKPERAPVDHPISAAPAEHNSIGRLIGAAATPTEASKSPITIQTGFKSSALNRNSASSAQDVASANVVGLETAKPVNGKQIDAQRVYSLDSLKTPILGLNGKNISADVSTVVGKNVELSGLSVKASLAGSDAVKATSASVMPLGIKRISEAGDSGIRTISQTAGTVDGVKLESLSINGLKTSLISFISGKPLGISEQASTVKPEASAVKVEIPTAGVKSGAFINGATFNTTHGIVGSIKVDVAGVKEAPIAISQVKDFSGKVEGAIAGVKVDAISGIKDGGISVIQLTPLTGKFASTDITSVIKTDATAANTTGSVSINGTNVQPIAQTIKGDVAGAGKVDAGVGRQVDGIKCNQQGDSAAGSVRGNILTPSFANAIASAIRFGYPMPEGITVENNGTFAVTYGNEVLYFPGLRAALKFAEVVGLIDGEVEKVEEEDEELQKPKVAATARVRYTVKEGETLESIAETELGDVRLSDLVMTINRSEILYRLTDAGKVPFVYPGQLILLPSEQELNIYRKNFFGKSGSKSSGMKGVSSAEITAEDESRESGRLVRRALHEEYIAHHRSLQPGRPKTTIRDLPKLQLGFSGISSAESLADDFQDQAYTHTVVSRPVKTEEHSTDNLAPISQPVCVEDNRLSTSAQTPVIGLGEQAIFLHASEDDYSDTVIVRDEEPAIDMERLLDVRVLSSCARALVTDLPRTPDVFFVRLEVRINDDWTVIASYDGHGDSTTRVRNSANGTKNSMQVNLPAHAVKTMAIEDFIRNWSTYKTNYENNNVGRIKRVDSVQPAPVNFKGMAVSK